MDEEKINYHNNIKIKIHKKRRKFLHRFTIVHYPLFKIKIENFDTGYLKPTKVEKYKRNKIIKNLNRSYILLHPTRYNSLITFAIWSNFKNRPNNTGGLILKHKSPEEFHRNRILDCTGLNLQKYL